MPHALIFGAGKIGRGFVGQLLHRGGYALRFVDPAPAMVARLRARGGYTVHVTGRDDLVERVPVDDAASFADDTWHPWLRAADLVASCVGAAQLDTLCAAVGAALDQRASALDWLICENADRPAERMRAHLGWPGRLGLVETQVLRSGMEPTAQQRALDPLAVRVTDWWTLPCDAAAFVGPLPAIPGLSPRADFGHELQRKLYTFNGLNGPIAYLGAERGHRLLDRAATDPALQTTLDQIQAESAHGLITEFDFDRDEHRAFQAIARAKYADPALDDAIARNAADLGRKLGPRERLLGPALLCHRHGRFPAAYVAAIAAALRYRGEPGDAGTAAVRAALAAEGPAATLHRFGQLAIDHPLNRAIVDRYQHQEVAS